MQSTFGNCLVGSLTLLPIHRLLNFEGTQNVEFIKRTPCTVPEFTWTRLEIYAFFDYVILHSSRPALANQITHNLPITNRDGLIAPFKTIRNKRIDHDFYFYFSSSFSLHFTFILRSFRFGIRSTVSFIAIRLMNWECVMCYGRTYCARYSVYW